MIHDQIPQDVTHVIKDFVSNGLLADPRGLVVWDLGCGDGRFTKAFIDCGAKNVLASDLHIPSAGYAELIQSDARVEWVKGGFSEAALQWGRPVRADIIFMSLMTEHVFELRQFLRDLALLTKQETEVLVHHDNYFQPVGHHDHALLFLNETTWNIEPQGVACWNSETKCAASQSHREALLVNMPQNWSLESEVTRNPANCESCNYCRRSRPWAHLEWGNDLRRVFPEPLFQSGVNRTSPEQLKWLVQEAGYKILAERRTWISNPVPQHLAQRYGQDNLSTFTITLRLRLDHPKA